MSTVLTYLLVNFALLTALGTGLYAWVRIQQHRLDIPGQVELNRRKAALNAALRSEAEKKQQITLRQEELIWAHLDPQRSPNEPTSDLAATLEELDELHRQFAAADEATTHAQERYDAEAQPRIRRAQRLRCWARRLEYTYLVLAVTAAGILTWQLILSM